jgi:hypothetical protein
VNGGAPQGREIGILPLWFSILDPWASLDFAPVLSWLFLFIPFFLFARGRLGLGGGDGGIGACTISKAKRIRRILNS